MKNKIIAILSMLAVAVMAISQPAFAAGTITTTTVQQDTRFRIGPAEAKGYKKAINANVKKTIAAINRWVSHP